MAKFAAYTGARQIELLQLKWDQVDFLKMTIKMIRAKQRGKKRNLIVDVIEMTEGLAGLMREIRLNHNHDVYVFPTSKGGKMPYTQSEFKGLWGKFRKQAQLDGINFTSTFHDLRAYYVTEQRRALDTLPNLHENPATTARIYSRGEEKVRKSN